MISDNSIIIIAMKKNKIGKGIKVPEGEGGQNGPHF